MLSMACLNGAISAWVEGGVSFAGTKVEVLPAIAEMAADRMQEMTIGVFMFGIGNGYSVDPANRRSISFQ
jgi:hypothetical protein